MSTLNLGKIRFNWTGAYNNSTAYVANDVVSSGGNSYICILASTGNAVSNATYWSLMAQAGTNGTDLTSTLTTQGDILYRDGSGLQRLAKGTASQQLAMNSGATAPEWVAPAGGGWTVLQSTNVTSNTSQVVLSGMSSAANTSLYNTWFFTVTDALPTSAGTSLCLRFGAIGVGFTYAGANDYGYHCAKVSDVSTSYSSQCHSGRSHIHMGLSVNTGTDRIHCVGWIGGHYNNNQIYAHGSYVCDTTGADFKGGTWHGSKLGDLNRTWDRIGILFESGDIAAGRFTLYGLKNS